jgi:hypothetical protein
MSRQIVITETQLRQIIRQEILREGALNVALDLAGLIPGVGEFADAANALLYAKDGKWLLAAFSLISLIPVIGDVIGKGGKLAVWLTKSGGKTGAQIVKNAPKAAAQIRDLKTKLIASKQLVKIVFDEAEKNPKLKEYVPEMRQALDDFAKEDTGAEGASSGGGAQTAVAENLRRRNQRLNSQRRTLARRAGF